MHRVALLMALVASLASGQHFDTEGSESLRRLHENHLLELLSPERKWSVQDSSLEYLGRWGWGHCGGVAVMGNYVFTGSGPTLLWLDMSDRRNPVIVWETLTNGSLNNFIIRDSIGYALLGGYGLLVVDFRNPLTPVIRAELPIPIVSSLLSLTVGGSLAFVKAYLGYLYCIDISDPFSPYLRSVIQNTTTQWGKLTISGHNLYVGDQDGFTEHVDVSNPDSARVTVLYNVVPTVTAAYARDTLLLLGNGSNRLYVYSITTPASPVQLSNANIGISGVASITLRGDTAFVGAFDGRVMVVNIADRRNPVVLGIYTPQVLQPELSAGSLAARDTTLYCSFWNGVTTFSVSDPASMNVLSFFPTGYTSKKIVVRNGLAYVASGYAGLWVVDISEPQHPRRRGNMQTSGYAYDVLVDSTIAYVSLNHPMYLRFQDAPNGLLVLDVQRADSIRTLSALDLDSPLELSKSGSLLFVTQANYIGPPLDSTLAILDVDDPRNPISMNRVVAGNARDIVSRDSFVFVASGSGFGSQHPGLNIYDVRNPAVPQLLSTTLTTAQGVSINGDFVYIHRGDSTFVVDISNLAAPAILGRIRHPPPSYSPGFWESVARQNTVFWANQGEFGILDVSDPYAPRNLFEVETFGEGGIAVVGDTIYLTRGDGVWIYRYNRGTTSVRPEAEPILESIHLLPNYPNPFNAVTQLKFVTKSQQQVEVSVFNVLGQHIRSLFIGTVDAGVHTIEFDANSLPSGTYFYRLQSKRRVLVGRMLLVK
jgi:hypothetical protein